MKLQLQRSVLSEALICEMTRQECGNKESSITVTSLQSEKVQAHLTKEKLEIK